MSRFGRHPWKTPRPAKVKAQLAAMEDFFGGRNGPGAPASNDRDHKSTGGAKRVVANKPNT